MRGIIEEYGGVMVVSIVWSGVLTSLIHIFHSVINGYT